MQYCDPAEVQLPETVCYDHEVKVLIQFFPEDQDLWTATTVVGIFNILAMITLIGFRLMNRNRLNLSESGESCQMDGDFFKFLIVYLAQGVAWIGAIIPAIFGFYFIIFFKLGPQPFSLLPSLSPYPTQAFVGKDAYLSFKICVYLSGVFDWIYMAHCIAHQCGVDVFFIDWEKSRGFMREAARSAGGRKRKKPTPISAWRSIMMANEWCKLGTARKTSIELTLVTMVFVMVGCDFQYIAVPRPNSLARDPGTRNILLDFGNNIIWFIIILMCQRIGSWILQRCLVDNPPILFVDLCTIAKVSVMVLDQNNRGYYLHCRSPYQYADGSIKDLLKQLAQEEENLTTARGLEDGTGEGSAADKGVSESCQTFEIYVTSKWRKHYNELYKEATEAAETTGGADESALVKNLKGARSIRRGKGDLPPEQMQEASVKISEFLRSYFDNSTEHRWKIGARTACARNCNQGPAPEMIASKSLLLPDDPITKMCGQRPRFERVLLYGIEAELNLFNIMTFCVLDLASQNKIAAAFGTYLFDRCVVLARAHFGRINVSKKTLIDQKFLF